MTFDLFRTAPAGDRPDWLLALFFVEPGFDRRLNFFVERLVVLQNFLRGIAALSELGALIVQPGTTFFNDLFFQCEIEKCAGRGNSLVVHDVEFGLGKRRCDLVLHDLNTGAIPCNDAIRLFDRADAPNIDAHTGIEFQGFSAGS